VWRSISGISLGVAVAGLVVLAGCGGGDQDTSAGASSPATSAAATATTVPATTTVAPTSATALLCPDVVLSSGPTDLANQIKAIGVSCAQAAALVAKVGPQVTPAGSPSQVESDGFVCRPAGTLGTDHGPPSAVFDCTNGAMKVGFVRS
jgi:hypothetical protein